MDVWTATFVAFGLLSQVGLLLYFAARRWRPDAERRWGWVIYALGLPAAGLALVGLGTPARRRTHPLAFAFSRPGPASARWWTSGCGSSGGARSCPPIFGAYVGLFVAAQFAFWIPLWWISEAAWITFAASTPFRRH